MPKSPTDRELLDAKDKVFDRLAKFDFVGGVGLSNSKIAVYLSRAPSKAEDQHIREIISSEAPGHEFELIQSGPFKKQ